MSDIIQILKALVETPLPSMFVVAGILFLFLSFADVININVLPEYRRWLRLLGGSFIVVGILLFGISVSGPTSVVTTPQAPVPTRVAGPSPISSLPTFTPTEPPVSPTIDPACGLTLIGGVGDLWRENKDVRDRLGCPRSPEEKGPASEELFQRGIMYWLNLNAEQQIYVMSASNPGRWSPYNIIYTGDPSVSPEGPFMTLIQNHPEFQLQEQMGSAVRAQAMLYGHLGSRQRFDDGVVLFSWAINGHGCRIYVLFSDKRFTYFDKGYCF